MEIKTMNPTIADRIDTLIFIVIVLILFLINSIFGDIGELSAEYSVNELILVMLMFDLSKKIYRTIQFRLSGGRKYKTFEDFEHDNPKED